MLSCVQHTSSTSLFFSFFSSSNFIIIDHFNPFKVKTNNNETKRATVHPRPYHMAFYFSDEQCVCCWYFFVLSLHQIFSNRIWFVEQSIRKIHTFHVESTLWIDSSHTITNKRKKKNKQPKFKSNFLSCLFFFFGFVLTVLIPHKTIETVSSSTVLIFTTIKKRHETKKN